MEGMVGKVTGKVMIGFDVAGKVLGEGGEEQVEGAGRCKTTGGGALMLEARRTGTTAPDIQVRAPEDGDAGWGNGEPRRRESWAKSTARQKAAHVLAAGQCLPSASAARWCSASQSGSAVPFTCQSRQRRSPATQWQWVAHSWNCRAAARPNTPKKMLLSQPVPGPARARSPRRCPRARNLTRFCCCPRRLRTVGESRIGPAGVDAPRRLEGN